MYLTKAKLYVYSAIDKKRLSQCVRAPMLSSILLTYVKKENEQKTACSMNKQKDVSRR